MQEPIDEENEIEGLRNEEEEGEGQENGSEFEPEEGNDMPRSNQELLVDQEDQTDNENEQWRKLSQGSKNFEQILAQQKSERGSEGSPHRQGQDEIAETPFETSQALIMGPQINMSPFEM